MDIIMHPSGCLTKHWAHAFGEVFGFPSMGVSRLAIALLCAFLFSCAQQQAAPHRMVPQLATCPKELGKHSLPDEPATVWQDYSCDNKLLPFVYIESVRICPNSPQAGQGFMDRIVYVACVSDASKPSTEVLFRQVRFQGKRLFHDSSTNFELKTGRWEDVALIKSPLGAKPGNYTYQVSFNLPHQAPNASADFPFTITK
jgi:hypothetical protein